MIVSDEYRYVFVQTPMTGCSAIANELVTNYKGKPILSKHAVYSTFLSNATEEQKSYFVFSAIRNPLDKVASNYQKMVNNHNSRFTQPLNPNFVKALFQRRDRILYRRIQRGYTFDEYLSAMKVYDELSSLDHEKFDFILRFENLASDFTKVLEILEIPPVRSLPVYNSTLKKRHFLDYYKSIESKRVAIKKFGPFLSRSNYSFPMEWGEWDVKWIDEIKYLFWHQIRIFSWRILRRNIRGHKL